MKFEYSDEVARARSGESDNESMSAVREEIPLAKDPAGLYRI